MNYYFSCLLSIIHSVQKFGKNTKYVPFLSKHVFLLNWFFTSSIFYDFFLLSDFFFVYIVTKRPLRNGIYSTKKD